MSGQNRWNSRAQFSSVDELNGRDRRVVSHRHRRPKEAQKKHSRDDDQVRPMIAFESAQVGEKRDDLDRLAQTCAKERGKVSYSWSLLPS